MQGKDQKSSPTTKQDNIDFKPIVKRITGLRKLSVVVSNKGYDSEENHILVRENLNRFCVIPPRYENVQYGNRRNIQKR